MNIRLYHVISAALFLSLAGCSDSEDWTPGPQDEEAGVRAYFPAPTKTSFVFEADADAASQTIEVKVARFETESAVSLPLTLSSETEGFSILGNAEFGAGQEETTVEVSCAAIPDGKMASFTLSVPDDQYYTYGQGLQTVSYSAIKASWIECADNVAYSYQYTSGKEMYPDTPGKMYRLEGTDRYRLTDFFGSGLEMEFECSTPTLTEFKPLINADYESCSSDSDYVEYGCWYLYNEEKQKWPTWTPGNAEGYPAVQYVVFYGDLDYSSMEMVYDDATLYGYMSLATDVTFDDGDFQWGTWYVSFNLKANPFK